MNTSDLPHRASRFLITGILFGVFVTGIVSADIPGYYQNQRIEEVKLFGFLKNTFDPTFMFQTNPVTYSYGWDPDMWKLPAGWDPSPISHPEYSDGMACGPSFDYAPSSDKQSGDPPVTDPNPQYHIVGGPFQNWDLSTQTYTGPEIVTRPKSDYCVVDFVQSR